MYKPIVRRAEQTDYVVLMPALSRAQHSLRPHIVFQHIEVHVTLPLGSGHRADLTFPARNDGLVPSLLG